MLVFSPLLFCFSLHLFLLSCVSLLCILVESAETGVVRLLLRRVAVESILTPVLITECGFCVTLMLAVASILLRETCKVLVLLIVWILGLWVLVRCLAVTVGVAANIVILLTFVSVGEHIISTGNLLELVFGLATILIRMVLLSKFVVLLLDFCLRRT
jgi:hypothetical protein